MAAPAFGTIGTKLNFTGTTQAVPVPASVASGDIIVVYLHVNSATATITARPTGFAAAEGSPAVNAGGVAGEIHVEWKRATGADSGTYSFTMSASVNSYAFAVRYTGCVAAGNPWDTPTAKADSSPTSVSTAPAVSITTAGSDRLLCYSSSNDNGASGTWSPPSGFTERAGGVSNSKVEVSDKTQAVQGSSGTVQCTTTASFATMNAWLGALIGTTIDAPTPMAQPQNLFPLFAGSPLRMPFRAPSFGAAPTVIVPNFLQDPPSRTRRVPPPRLRRAGQVTPALPVAPPDMAPGSAPAQRHVWVRRRARLAVPPAPQAVPVDADQLQRPRRRPAPARSRSAQPPPVQVAAPVNPGFVPAGIGHRLRVALRRGRFTTAPTVQVQPPELDLSQRRRTALRVRSRAAQLVPPQFNPPLAPQPLAHRIRIGFRRYRPVVLPMAQETSPPVPARRRWQVARVRSRAAQPTPPQFNPPIVPLTVGHRLRVALRRGRASQPVPVVAAPITPTFVPDALTHRLRLLFRRPRAGQRPTVVPQGTEQPPTLTTGPRLLVRPRRGATAAPVPAQVNPPWIPSASPRKIRPVLRRGDGRTASPTPTQQTAPTNPAFVFVDIRKVRASLVRRSRTAWPMPTQQAAPINPGTRRRRVGLPRRPGSATPIPAQQTVIPNPPLVFVTVRKVRALLVRRSRTATTVRPQHFPEVPNRAGVTPGLLARRGRSAQPPIVQTQPPTSPAVRNRQRRRVQVWQRRGRDAWRELGQAVAPVVQFFQGVITGGTLPGPSSTGGTLAGPTSSGSVLSGPVATGRFLLGTLDFYLDVYSDTYPGGVGATDLGVTGATNPGAQATGATGPGPQTAGTARPSNWTGATMPGAATVGQWLTGSGMVGGNQAGPGETGAQQHGTDLTGGSR